MYKEVELDCVCIADISLNISFLHQIDYKQIRDCYHLVCIVNYVEEALVQDLAEINVINRIVANLATCLQVLKSKPAIEERVFLNKELPPIFLVAIFLYYAEENILCSVISYKKV